MYPIVKYLSLNCVLEWKKNNKYKFKKKLLYKLENCSFSRLNLSNNSRWSVTSVYLQREKIVTYKNNLFFIFLWRFDFFPFFS